MPGWGEGDTLMGKSLAETAGGDRRRNIRQIILGLGSAFGWLSIRILEAGPVGSGLGAVVSETAPKSWREVGTVDTVAGTEIRDLSPIFDIGVCEKGPVFRPLWESFGDVILSFYAKAIMARADMTGRRHFHCVWVTLGFRY